MKGLIACLCLGVASSALGAQTPDTVFLEELTWTEVREAGKTTVIFRTGGTEQNGPHMVLGKHNFIVKHTVDKIARRLGNALVAPVLAYVPEGKHFVPEYYNENGFRAWLQSQGEKKEDIGTHAGISDTSQLMAVNPAWVRKDKLAAGGDRTLTGVSGNPARASAAYGAKGLEFKIEAAVAQIRKSIGAKGG